MTLRSLLTAAALVAVAASAHAQAAVGQPAPAFTLTDTTGTTHNLADFRGKYVVLEWYNPSCPFVVKHYTNGDMQRLQAEYAAKGVVWLQVNSTSRTSGDFRDAAASNANRTEWNVTAATTLLDTDGTVGRAYGARTTPHMFVINPEGTVIYNGAIDSIRSANAADVGRANNFVRAALDAAMGGRAVETATTQPYGCSVKY